MHRTGCPAITNKFYDYSLCTCQPLKIRKELSMKDLIAEARALPDPDKNVLSHNERALIKLAGAMADELERTETAILSLEYAAQIDANNRRGAFIKAFVEQEAWAVADFNAWRGRRTASTTDDAKTDCPECGAVRLLDEVAMNYCIACGYPHDDDKDPAEDRTKHQTQEKPNES